MTISTPLKASVILRCARVDGLVPILHDLYRQDFQDSWEIILVDWLYEERKELMEYVHNLLSKNATHPPRLKHVKPLEPLPFKGKYSCWDIPLSFNTGWVHAEGEISVHIEDYWRVRPWWLKRHVEYATKHPNLLIFGDLLRWDTLSDDPPKIHGYDENAPTHYGMMRNVDFLADSQDLKDVIEDPTKFISVNAGRYGRAICVNFSHRTEYAFKCNGLPEVESRNPESLMYRFLDQGLSIYTPTDLPAWHICHPGGRITGHVLSFDFAGGTPSYRYIQQTHHHEIMAETTEEHALHYTRNLMDERMKRGY